MNLKSRLNVRVEDAAYSVQESISGRMSLENLYSDSRENILPPITMSIELEKISHIATLNKWGKKMTDEAAGLTKNPAGFHQLKHRAKGEIKTCSKERSYELP